MKTISKKVPVAMACGWLACVVAFCLFWFVSAFSDPMQYVAFIEEMLASGWRGELLLTAVAAVAALSVLPIWLTAKKAGVTWLKIVSLVYMLVNGSMAIICGIKLLTSLL